MFCFSYESVPCLLVGLGFGVVVRLAEHLELIGVFLSQPTYEWDYVGFAAKGCGCLDVVDVDTFSWEPLFALSALILKLLVFVWPYIRAARPP